MDRNLTESPNFVANAFFRYAFQPVPVADAESR
jgi:hypothetical protein